VAESLDVPARLGDGRSAVDIIGEYVWACHLVGYQNPDLTLHAAQVRDWYGSEDGLDLRALEADRAALDAAATATDSARRLQEEQTDALAGAWQGRGADASRAFLARHAEASASAASAVRDATDALAALRDDLWQAVDAKVGAAVEIEGRRQTERAEWLSATRTVTTGAGDRVVASELVDQKVKPFVDNDIRAEWLAAMQKTMAAASAAFDDATSVLTGEPAMPFEVPGDLGPGSIPSPREGAQVADVAGTAPAAWTSPSPAAVVQGPAPAVPPPVAPTAGIPAAPEPLAAPVPAAAAPAPAAPPSSGLPTMPPMPSAGELGGGLPGAAGGLAGLGTQLGDAIGGLVNRPDEALPDPQQLENAAIDDGPPGVEDDEPAVEDDEPAVDDEAHDDEAVDDEADDEVADEADDLAGADEAADESDDTCADDSVAESPVAEPVATPPPEPMPPPPMVEPPPSAEAIGAKTPCEIAADELPQAGP
jgi:hypothetical protein